MPTITKTKPQKGGEPSCYIKRSVVKELFKVDQSAISNEKKKEIDDLDKILLSKNAEFDTILNVFGFDFKEEQAPTAKVQARQGQAQAQAQVVSEELSEEAIEGLKEEQEKVKHARLIELLQKSVSGYVGKIKEAVDVDEVVNQFVIKIKDEKQISCFSGFIDRFINEYTDSLLKSLQSQNGGKRKSKRGGTTPQETRKKVKQIVLFVLASLIQLVFLAGLLIMLISISNQYNYMCKDVIEPRTVWAALTRVFKSRPSPFMVQFCRFASENHTKYINMITSLQDNSISILVVVIASLFHKLIGENAKFTLETFINVVPNKQAQLLIKGFIVILNATNSASTVSAEKILDLIDKLIDLQKFFPTPVANAATPAVNAATPAVNAATTAAETAINALQPATAATTAATTTSTTPNPRAFKTLLNMIFGSYEQMVENNAVNLAMAAVDADESEQEEVMEVVKEKRKKSKNKNVAGNEEEEAHKGGKTRRKKTATKKTTSNPKPKTAAPKKKSTSRHRR